MMNGSEARHPVEVMRQRAEQWGVDLYSEEFARRMDAEDPLRELRKDFHIPKQGGLPHVDPNLISNPDDDCLYFCGQSLGLQPKSVGKLMKRELDKWAEMGVHGHVEGVMPWQSCEDVLVPGMEKMLGAKSGELAMMNGLTINLHLLLISFYRPTPTRHKILLENHAFPSDHYAIESQLRLHGFDPETSMICMKPREGEHCLRLEDILDVIEREGESIAVVAFPGVQYYTGQMFDMPTITKAAQAKGCYVGWDLAHATGNVELSLHDWNVDFACLCSYKYLNAGAGSIGGLYINERHSPNDFPRLMGWWGHQLATRFVMDNVMQLTPGAGGYKVSNHSPAICVSVEASLEVFNKTSMAELRAKSKLLTGYLEHLLLTKYPKPDTPGADGATYVEIISPSDPEQRGCQLSVYFSTAIGKVFTELEKRAVVVDKREPNVLRVAPVPLYNSFTDVYKFVRALGEAMKK